MVDIAVLNPIEKRAIESITRSKWASDDPRRAAASVGQGIVKFGTKTAESSWMTLLVG